MISSGVMVASVWSGRSRRGHRPRNTLGGRTCVVLSLVALSALDPRWAGAAEPEEREVRSRYGLWGPRSEGHAFGVRLVLDYARATTDAYGLRLDPYALGAGLSISYTTPSGLGFGLVGDIYQGRTISQVYVPPLTSSEIMLDAQSRLADVGFFASYDQPLGPVVLRSSLTVAFGFLSWDFGDLPYASLAGFSPMQGTELAPNLDPGFGVFWPVGFLETGFRLHYRIPLSGSLPAALGGALSLGVGF